MLPYSLVNDKPNRCTVVSREHDTRPSILHVSLRLEGLTKSFSVADSRGTEIIDLVLAAYYEFPNSESFSSVPRGVYKPNLYWESTNQGRNSPPDLLETFHYKRAVPRSLIENEGYNRT